MVNPEDVVGPVKEGSPLPLPMIGPELKPELLPGTSGEVQPSPPGQPRLYDCCDWGGDSMDNMAADPVIDQLFRGELGFQDALLALMPDIPEPDGGWTESYCAAIICDMMHGIPRRVKQPQYNTFEDAVELIRNSKSIMILSGAGVSVACGIPDFRSKNGIYARLHKDFPDLPDPTSMFDISYFDRNPKPFYDFANEIFMGRFEPSLSHKFVRQLELKDKLLRNFTQNIDTLENQAGIERVVECHGSFATATCRQCKTEFNGEEIRVPVMEKRVAYCPVCKDGIIKPNIIFFGEDLPQSFHKHMIADKNSPDLLIVMGSSLRVAPVNAIPSCIPKEVPQILINRESLPHYKPDIELLGNCDDIIREICYHLGEEFETLVENHDEKKKTLDPEYKSLTHKRTMIDHDEFVKIMHDGEELQEQSGEEEDSVEPVVKRPRPEPAYKRRYIRVTKKLPRGGYYFQTRPNTAIFFGSYVYYDLEKKRLVNAPERYETPPYALMDKEDSCGGSESTITRRGSEPPEIFNTRDCDTPNNTRATSCEPTIDLDSLIPCDEFRKTLDGDDDDDSDDLSSMGGWGAFSDGGESPKHEFKEDEEEATAEVSITVTATAEETAVDEI